MNVPDERGLKLVVSDTSGFPVPQAFPRGEMNVPDERGLKLLDEAETVDWIVRAR